MTRAESLTRRWSSRSLARIGGLVGLVMALMFTARLIQVQIRPGRAGLWFALVYGGLLLSPFVASLAALAQGNRRRELIWKGAGVFAALLSLTDAIAYVTLPLLIPAAFLVAAGWRASSERRLKGSP